MTTVYPARGLLVWQRGGLTTISGAITRWIGCIARSSGACRDVRRADDHLRCYHALDWLHWTLVRRMSRREEG
ncbi:MAG: hypothetical protein KatS3mg056_2227 [Chloroflexus sp.]|nr:MAG: hypothetical protein KatS3mg056_2227 [Chloroflexus sp.]